MLAQDVGFRGNFSLESVPANAIEAPGAASFTDILGLLQPSGYGEIGRHARFRFWCRKAWEFKSLYPHQLIWQMTKSE